MRREERDAEARLSDAADERTRERELLIKRPPPAFRVENSADILRRRSNHSNFFYIFSFFKSLFQIWIGAPLLKLQQLGRLSSGRRAPVLPQRSARPQMAGVFRKLPTGSCINWLNSPTANRSHVFFFINLFSIFFLHLTFSVLSAWQGKLVQVHWACV